MRRPVSARASRMTRLRRLPPPPIPGEPARSRRLRSRLLKSGRPRSGNIGSDIGLRERIELLGPGALHRHRPRLGNAWRADAPAPEHRHPDPDNPDPEQTTSHSAFPSCVATLRRRIIGTPSIRQKGNLSGQRPPPRGSIDAASNVPQPFLLAGLRFRTHGQSQLANSKRFACLKRLWPPECGGMIGVLMPSAQSLP